MNVCTLNATHSYTKGTEQFQTDLKPTKINIKELNRRDK
jgi:hypothetical protein